MPTTTKKVRTLIGPHQRGRWLLVVALALLVSLAEALSTLLVFALLGMLVGDAGALQVPVIGDMATYLPWQGTDLLVAVGLATAVLFLLRSVLIVGQNYVQFRVAENAGARLSARLLRGYLAMPYAFHLQRNSSEMVRNAFDSVHQFVTEGLVPGVKVLSKLGIVFGVGAVLIAASPRAALFAVAALAPLTWLVLRVVHPRIKRLGRIAQTMSQQNLQALQQSLHGVRDISLLRREATFVAAYTQDRRALARAQYLRQTAVQIPRVVIETGLVFFIVAFVGIAATTQENVAGTLPLLGLFGYAGARLMPELQQITQGLNQFKFVGPAIDDIHADLIAFEGQGGQQPLAQVPPLPFRQGLTAQGVGYRYPNSEVAALADIDVEVRPGDSIGIVGPSGGGKSTLVDLLLGLLEPTEGRVSVDGVDLHPHARQWQANLGVVPQMVFLIDDTLRANIALGVPRNEIDEDALAQALSLAQLDEFVGALPRGLETLIGERGMRISGGQRQRIAIARALYHQPKVLIFDEGTSALDNETEKALTVALRGIRATRTTITVAHRLSTVQDCDTVWLLRGGRIVDRGSFPELVVRNPELAGVSPPAPRIHIPRPSRSI